MDERSNRLQAGRLQATPEDVTEAFRAIERDAAFSGVVLQRSGSARRILARGWADRKFGRPNEARTRFNVASLTKLFTAVAVCRLVEGGSATFETPLAAILPTIAGRERITLEHLLTHTSGLPEEMPERPSGGRPDAGWVVEDDLPLIFAPGGGWQYSNPGYALLGAVIERLTGTSYFEAMGSLVFRPARMVATGFEDSDEYAPGRALGYLDDGENGEEPTDNRASGLGRGAPYGYAYSTVEDLERLIDAIVEGDLVDAQSADRILRGDVPTDQPSRLAGFGMFLDVLGSLRITTSSGAGPGISAWLDVIPDRGDLAIVLANVPKPAAHRVGELLRATAW